MRLETSLRGRIVAAYVGLSLAVCGCFALVAWFALVEAQKYVVQRRLESLAEWQFQRADVTADLPRCVFQPIVDGISG